MKLLKNSIRFLSKNEITLFGVIIQQPHPKKPEVVINYTSIPGNKPVENTNWAGFWYDADSKYWESQPLAATTVTNSNSNQVVIQLDTIDYGTYIVGYYTDAETTIPRGAPSATISFKGSEQGSNPQSCSFKNIEYKNGNLGIEYTTPAGNDPAANSNAIAIWESDRIDWECHWMNQISITQRTSSGQILWPIILKKDQAYTLAYMNGIGCSNIAATCSFQIQ